MPAPLYLAAATATGKTDFALALAEHLPVEIVNADAFQLYAGLGICTAQPSQEEQGRVQHHLFGTLEPTERCDAGRYQQMAQAVIAEVLGRGHWPLVVGGSGLYLKSLTHGLAELPRGDDALRAELALHSAAERVAWLLRLDPEAEKNVPLSNDRYVTRALEICLLTGQPQSALRRGWQGQQPEFMGVLLQRERAELVGRIDARVHSMVAAGLVQEVEALLQRYGLKPEQATPEVLERRFPTAHKAIGVLQVCAYLRGECSLAEAVAQMQLISRQYAKRQATWFRREVGFQTICLSAEFPPQSALHRLPELFPCLSLLHLPARSLLT